MTDEPAFRLTARDGTDENQRRDTWSDQPTARVAGAEEER